MLSVVSMLGRLILSKALIVVYMDINCLSSTNQPVMFPKGLYSPLHIR